MAEARHQSAIIGWVGVLCLAVYWIARLAPEIADTFAVSSFGKFAVFGTLLVGVLLTAIAAVRSSRWWLIAVAVAAITLADVYHFSRVLR